MRLFCKWNDLRDNKERFHFQTFIFFAIFPVYLGSCECRWQFSNCSLYYFSISNLRIKRHYCDTLSGANSTYSETSHVWRRWLKTNNELVLVGLTITRRMNWNSRNTMNLAHWKKKTPHSPPPISITRQNLILSAQNLSPFFTSFTPFNPFLELVFPFLSFSVECVYILACSWLCKQVCVSSVWPFVRLPRSATTGCETSVNKHFYHDQPCINWMFSGKQLIENSDMRDVTPSKAFSRGKQARTRGKVWNTKGLSCLNIDFFLLVSPWYWYDVEIDIFGYPGRSMRHK